MSPRSGYIANAVLLKTTTLNRLSLKVPRCFIFKPDGIGDFFLASGVVRLMARELGEKNLTIAVLPILESVVRGQFPQAEIVILPIKKQRVILNVFVANCLRCFPSWIKLLGTRADTAISLRHMRDYLQSFLFYSVRAGGRFMTSNLLLGNGRRVRRWTEKIMVALFSTEMVDYPKPSFGIPSELEAHRLLVSAALRRDVEIGEIWPELKAVNPSPIDSLNFPYFVCAPYSSDIWKNFPEHRWIELFVLLDAEGKGERLRTLILTGSPDQRESLESFGVMIRKALPETKISISVLISENLQGFIDLLAGAECVFTIDTAAAHGATALNCRTLILFSGLHQGMFAPWIRSHRQHWVLPKESQSNLQWHEAHSTSEIMISLDKILSAP